LEPGPVTQLLHEAAAGDTTALNRLIPLVYAELRRLAGGFLRGERPGHTLQPTALVHEAYVRLLQQNQRTYQNRAHFLGVAAHIMRQILIDHARARSSAKRGGGQATQLLDESADAAVEQPGLLLSVHDALEVLQQKDPRKARLIEMRFFGGMTAEESAEALAIPVEHVRADLRVAQAWLKRELEGSGPG
jgi:RNA polymerase sigma factor (TIGR02999 family)